MCWLIMDWVHKLPRSEIRQKQQSIKAVLSAMPNHLMSTCRFSTKDGCKLNRLIRDFWWGYDLGRQHCYIKAWDSFQLPKHMGGLGIRISELVNMALAMKLGWKLLFGEHCIWMNLFRTLYFPDGDFWGATPRAGCSPTWRAIMEIKPILFEGCFHVIGDGRATNVWCDNWIPHQVTMVLPELWTSDMLLKVRDLLEQHGSWDRDKVFKFFPGVVVDLILNIPICPDHLEKDQVIWKPRSNGFFSVRSAFQFLISMRMDGQPSATAPLCKALWKFKFLAPCVHLFIWRCLSSAVQLGDVLAARIPSFDSCCLLCGLA